MEIVGLLAAAVNPLPMFYLRSGEVYFDVDELATYVVYNLDPLFQVGIGLGTIGFGSYFAMLIVWIMLISFMNLPADSKGVIMGWIGGTYRGVKRIS